MRFRRALPLRRMEEVSGRARLSRRDRQALLLGAVAADPRDRRGAHHRHHGRDPAQGQPYCEPCPLSCRTRHTTITEHMPSAHRRYAEWTPARMMSEAAKIGPATIALVEAIMKAKPHPEQGFRACLGILRLENSYGSARIEAACRRGNDIGATSYGSVESILQHGLDRAYAQEKPPDGQPIRHANIRGGLGIERCEVAAPHDGHARVLLAERAAHRNRLEQLRTRHHGDAEQFHAMAAASARRWSPTDRDRRCRPRFRILRGLPAPRPDGARRAAGAGSSAWCCADGTG